MGHSTGQTTPESALEWLEAAPPGTRLDAGTVAKWLEAALEDREHVEEAPAEPKQPEWTWREKLWLAPAETRIGVRELAEAMGKSSSWIYKRTGEKAGRSRLPVRKLDGELVFTVGEIRTWIRRSEEVEAALPMEKASREFGVIQGGAA